MEKNNSQIELISDTNQDSKFENYFSIREVLDDDTPPPDQIIGDGILLEQTMLLLSGKKKVGKSMLAMNLGLAIANGVTFSIFKIIEKHTVLLLSSEGGYFPNRDRIKKMSTKFQNYEKTEFNMCFDPRLKLDTQIGQEQLWQVVKYYKPEVLILDPLIKFHNSDENSSKDMNVVMTQLRNLIEDYKLSIILIHHFGKNETLGPRGSSVITGEYDSCIEMALIDKIERKVSLEFDLRHSESPEKKEIVFNPSTFWFESKRSILSPAAKVVYDSGSISRQELCKKLVESGKYSSDTNAQKAIKKDIDRKLLISDPNGIISLIDS